MPAMAFALIFKLLGLGALVALTYAIMKPRPEEGWHAPASPSEEEKRAEVGAGTRD